jgi:hypothetical protein
MSDNVQRSDIIIILIVAVAMLVLIFTSFGENRTVIYDCRMSEISPDFPIEVKEECRKLLKQHIDNESKRGYIKT